MVPVAITVIQINEFKGLGRGLNIFAKRPITTIHMMNCNHISLNNISSSLLNQSSVFAIAVVHIMIIISSQL